MPPKLAVLKKQKKQTSHVTIKKTVGKMALRTAEKRDDVLVQKWISLNEQDRERDAKFCHQYLADNKAHVPYIASLMRRGLIARMMQQEAGITPDPSTMGTISAPAKLAIVTELFPTWPQDSEDNMLTLALGYLLHVTKEKPLPIWFLDPLKELCRQRWVIVGERCKDRDFTEEPPEESDFKFFVIKENMVHCSLTGDEIALPSPPPNVKNMGWQIEDDMNPFTAVIARNATAIELHPRKIIKSLADLVTIHPSS
eukprot:3284717-Amphidinium_carterae.1